MTSKRKLDVPQRIQRLRTKGYVLPSRSVYVGRGSIWGNPFKIGADSGYFEVDEHTIKAGNERLILMPAVTREQSIALYRSMIMGVLTPEMFPHGHEWHERFKAVYRDRSVAEALRWNLRGKTLCCWCALDEPCHADVLIDLANER